MPPEQLKPWRRFVLAMVVIAFVAGVVALAFASGYVLDKHFGFPF